MHYYSLVSNEKRNNETGKRHKIKKKIESKREHTLSTVTFSSSSFSVVATHLIFLFHNKYTPKEKVTYNNTRTIKIENMYGRYTFNVYDTNSTIARTRKTCTFERSTLDDGRVSTNQPQSRGEALPSPSPAPSPATPSHCLPRHHVVSPLLVFSVSLVLARLHVCFLSFPHLCLRQSAS